MLFLVVLTVLIQDSNSRSPYYYLNPNTGQLYVYGTSGNAQAYPYNFANTNYYGYMMNSYYGGQANQQQTTGTVGQYYFQQVQQQQGAQQAYVYLYNPTNTAPVTSTYDPLPALNRWCLLQTYSGCASATNCAAFEGACSYWINLPQYTTLKATYAPYRAYDQYCGSWCHRCYTTYEPCKTSASTTSASTEASSSEATSSTATTTDSTTSSSTTATTTATTTSASTTTSATTASSAATSTDATTAGSTSP